MTKKINNKKTAHLKQRRRMQKCTVPSHADDEVNFVIKLLAFTNEFKDSKKN